ncbi:DUF2269 domain-containing protein [Bacillus sp. DJP31]|uniref:DUF2269 domain-containing protein n=1 Tax=Bacillus sp. DJP31 TaxID=3409789 RepID=UPI003BB718FB
MAMTPRLRKFALTIHVTSSVGWLGVVVSYLALVVAAMTSQNTQMGRSVWIAMELIGWYVIVPLAIASLVTGLVMSLGTQWGLFRHYWVLFKLLLTIIATSVLLQTMPTVSFLAGVVAESDSINLVGLQSQLLHAGGGLFVLLVTTILSVYKPRGMTLYGQRKHQMKSTNNSG